jgi:hypothetical protein
LERCHADVTASRLCALLKKEKLKMPLEWKLCGSTVSNSSALSGMHIKSLILEII